MNNVDEFPGSQVDIIENLRNRIEQSRLRFKDRSLPFITLTYAQSIDGCIAPFGGGTLQLSNSKTRQLTHQIRGLHDSILVGINTVLCDDPQLTVRLATGKNPQPIVLDSELRFPLEANLLRDPCVPPIIATGMGACEKKAERLIAAGARLVRVPLLDGGLIDLSQVLTRIKQLGFHSVMVEGGAKVITSVLTSRIADHFLLAIAPRFVGGLRAVNPSEAAEQMPQLYDVQYHVLEGDLVVCGQFSPRDGSSVAPFPHSDESNPLPNQLLAGAKKGGESHDEN